MADIAQETDLQHLESLYPHGEITSSSDGNSYKTLIQNPWYLVTLASFAAANRPEAVPLLFKYVLGRLEQAQNRFNTPVPEANHEKYLLAHRFRDAIFKGGVIGGYSRAINALVSLLEVTPEELRDTNRQRDTTLSLPELEKRGQVFFQANYGETADDVQGLLDRIYPDMGWFSNTIAYGTVYGYTEILDQLETSYILVGSLIAVDTPRQIDWHLANARRGGASLEQIRAVRQIAICASQSAGVKWRNVIPEIKE
ncbi:AhpD-like protein [Russula decolorans]